MHKQKFKLSPNFYINVDVALVRTSKVHGEIVHTTVANAKIRLSDTGVYPYSVVSCGLQSAVCTALDTMISAMDESDLK